MNKPQEIIKIGRKYFVADYTSRMCKGCYFEKHWNAYHARMSSGPEHFSLQCCAVKRYDLQCDDGFIVRELDSLYGDMLKLKEITNGKLDTKRDRGQGNPR